VDSTLGAPSKTGRRLGHRMRQLLATGLFLTTSVVSAEELHQPKQAAIEVVTQFVEGCFRRFPYPEEFAEWVNQPGHRKLSDQEAAPLLPATGGDAWAATTPHSSFFITSLGRSACTVFASGLDEQTTRDMVKGFLGYLETQGASWTADDTTPARSGPGYSSTNYSITLNGRPTANITLSIAPPRPGGFQVALTVAKS
jgi:hypothetical protein